MRTYEAPDVTVVVGAYEAMPYLIRCLESVESQTLGPHRIELVAVNDGSTDGTGEYLDEFAARSAVPTRVVHQANSGGPSGPRNVGLSMARGRFVFFLDADDYFTDDALERMVAMADKAGTDVVLGKLAGVNRKAPNSMFKRTVERADIYNSRVIYTLSAEKLFRRELLIRQGIRFDTSLYTGEDQMFTLQAYLRGNGVSVVADSPCLWIVGRDDGKQVTKSGTYAHRFDSAVAITDLVAELLPPGAKRDKIMVRPLWVTLLQQFNPPLLRAPEGVMEDKVARGQAILEKHWNPRVAKHFRVVDRIRLECIARGRSDLLADVLRFMDAKKLPEIVLRGRDKIPYLAFPHFGSRTAGLPIETFRVTVTDWSGDTKITPVKQVRRPVSRTRRVARKVRGRVRKLTTAA
ncbi:glycosyltransferase family 2 protein [Streptomyces montanisoli]|uniref:Glycosyltransferase family 2 protein n=1 Tax=Streptomyces montanisoli TaxID=2798581 RepID=A0A940RVP2_9ACTN|nr:glycosyltransferase family 2 protein [Streptomyces montanisoli]MBP0458451.1 glycosyltransferase family 2 protein [Streptomyces montanisoli]